MLDVQRIQRSISAGKKSSGAVSAAMKGRKRRGPGGVAKRGSEPTSFERYGVKAIPTAMAWDSDHLTFAEGMPQTETAAADPGFTRVSRRAQASKQSGVSFLSPAEDGVAPPDEAMSWQEPLPESVLFFPYSSNPLASVDLSAWQDQLSAATVEDLLRRNSSFSTLILRGIKREGNQLHSLIARYFGSVVVEIDVSYSTFVDAKWLAALAGECPSIAKISVAQCPRVTDAAVRILARKKGRALLSLNVAGCKNVTDDGVEVLAKYCSSLRSLDVSGCPRVRDRSVYAMSTLHGLEEVILDGCAEVSNEAARHLFNNVTKLTYLSIKGCPNLTEAGLRYMYEIPVPWGVRRHHNCAQIETFRIGSNTFVSDDFVMVLAIICPRMRILEVESCPLIGGDDAMDKIGGLGELAEFRLDSLQRVSDHGIQRFFSDQPKRSLTSLSLAGCPKITDVSLRLAAKNAGSLRCVRLDHNVSVTDRGLGYIAKGLPSLRLLQATHLSMVSDDGIRLIARKCLRLTDLDISHCVRVSGASLSALRRLRGLEALGLSGCRSMLSDVFHNGDSSSVGRDTDTTALNSADFQTLRQLRLANHPDLRDEAVRAVIERNSKTLTLLDLSHCPRITAVGLTDAVRVLSTLTRLDLTSCARISIGDIECLARSAPPSLRLSCATMDVDGFDGLHCCGNAADARLRARIIALEREENIAAGTVQRAFWRYKEREKVLHETLRRQDQLTWAAMVIQVRYALPRSSSSNGPYSTAVSLVRLVMCNATFGGPSSTLPDAVGKFQLTCKSGTS